MACDFSLLGNFLDAGFTEDVNTRVGDGYIFSNSIMSAEETYISYKKNMLALSQQLQYLENGDIDYFIVAVLLVDDESRELFWDSFDGNALKVYIITNYDNATSFIENEWGVNPTN